MTRLSLPSFVSSSPSAFASRGAALRRRSVLASGVAAAALALSGCGLTGTTPAAEGDDKTISIIVTESAPFQEPTEIAKELLAEQGWTLETTYVTDIVQPNQVVSRGEYDANFFQNLSYLDAFNRDNALDIQPTFPVYAAPGAIYSRQHSSLADLPDGARIALPVDTANNGRGLKILADAGLLSVDPEVPVSRLSQDAITDNPHGFVFVEVDQQSVAQTLPDVDAAFTFVRLAAEIGLNADDALAFEDPQVAEPYSIVVAAPAEFAGTEKAEALREAYQSEEVSAWFDEYQGGVLDTAYDLDLERVWASVQQDGEGA
ncbi:MAG: MetQ/NlpA family ABC transporter substrate-binding protein [Micrococcus sp.]|nr:MetQ/NlpA family ABC transporter substrate-binding protein [Micrococcus sp.]